MRYASRPKRTILGWQDGCARIEIYYIDPEGLTFPQWISKHAIPSARDQKVTVNGMHGIIEFVPQADLAQIYLERAMNDGSPLIYEIDFVGSRQKPPPFWQDMLNSFQTLAISL